MSGEAVNLAELERLLVPLELRDDRDALLNEILCLRGACKFLLSVNETAEQMIAETRAQVETLREALRLIAAEDEGEEYEFPDWETVKVMPPCTFRPPAVARAALEGASDE